MPSALKKHLVKMEISQGDIVIMKPPLYDHDQEEILRFGGEVARQLADMGLGPLIILPQLFSLETMTQEQLAQVGLCRVIPIINPASPALAWDDYEDQAHQLVRLAFKTAREKFEAQSEVSSDAS